MLFARLVACAGNEVKMPLADGPNEVTQHEPDGIFVGRRVVVADRPPSRGLSTSYAASVLASFRSELLVWPILSYRGERL